MKEKTTYFFSDAHFGAGDEEQEKIKLEKLSLLIDEIVLNNARCFILGDLFDFWFEFRKGIPNGYEKILEILKNASNKGIEFHFIGGNHDWWAGKKLEELTGMTIHKKPFIYIINDKKFFATHGDGLARSDFGYKYILRPIFRNRINIWLFRQFPKSAGEFLARSISSSSKLYTKKRNLRMESEYVDFAKKLCDSGVDFVIQGHTHEPAHIVKFDHGTYINVGDFFEQFSFARLFENKIELRKIN